MDLRKIVDEVESRKKAELALVAPPASPRPPTASSGSSFAASLMLAAREVMEREPQGAPEATAVGTIEPDLAHPRPQAPRARAVEDEAPAVKAKKKAGRAQDDFLARYLLMSEEFEKRYHVRGWGDFVRKKCSAHMRQ